MPMPLGKLAGYPWVDLSESSFGDGLELAARSESALAGGVSIGCSGPTVYILC